MLMRMGACTEPYISPISQVQLTGAMVFHLKLGPLACIRIPAVDETPQGATMSPVVPPGVECTSLPVVGEVCITLDDEQAP